MISSLERRGLSAQQLDEIIVTEEDRISMHAGTPMEGRYRKSAKKLFKYTSEFETVRRRIWVEVEYLIDLSDEMNKYTGERPKIISRVFTDEEKQNLRNLCLTFDDKAFMQFKTIEDKTQHDVVATTEWMKYRLSGAFENFESIEGAIHFCLTSEDINRNVHAAIFRDIIEEIYLPMAMGFSEKLIKKGDEWEDKIKSDLEEIVSAMENKPEGHELTEKEEIHREWVHKLYYLYGKKAVCTLLKKCAEKGAPWIAKTHGRDAVPTKLSKVLMSSARAITTHIDTEFREVSLDSVAYRMKRLYGKLTGAAGNMNSHEACYPDIHWKKFAKNFVESFGLKNYYMNDQCEPYISDVQFLSYIKNVTEVTHKAANDVWDYIYANLMKKKPKKESSGSSAMPQKANPWEIEGALRYLKWAVKDIDFLASELPNYQMQGDMGRSILTRSYGIPISKLMIAYDRISKSLNSYEPDTRVLIENILAHPEIATETIQNILRQYGVNNAYDATKDLSMGKNVKTSDYKKFLQGLVDQNRIPESAMDEIMGKIYNPNENLGDAIESVQKSKEQVYAVMGWFRKAIEQSKKETPRRISC